MRNTILFLWAAALLLGGCAAAPEHSPEQDGGVRKPADSKATLSAPERSANTTAAGTTAAGTTIRGVITDSMCGLNHEGMLRTGSMGDTDASCILKCVEAGSRFVLADPQSGTIYNLKEQEKAVPFAGMNVQVTGRLNEKTRVLYINEISAIPSG